MSQRDRMFEIAWDWREKLIRDHERGRRIFFRKSREKHDDAKSPRRDLSSSREEPEIIEVSSCYENAPEQHLTSLPMIDAVVVGIDIREYSRRSAAGKLMISSILFANVQKAVRILRECGYFEPDEPRIMVQTGDGAAIIFNGELPNADDDDPGLEPAVTGDADKYLLIEKALSLVYTLNVIISEDNRRKAFDDADWDESDDRHLRITPIYPRFAISMDKVMLVMDVNDDLNCVGDAIITCARILSSDHGNHFLLQDRVLHRIEDEGGMDRICQGSPFGSWDQTLHISEFDDRPIKSGRFRYAACFGHHTDAPLLRMLGRPSVAPTRYGIGSHNVRALD